VWRRRINDMEIRVGPGTAGGLNGSHIPRSPPGNIRDFGPRQRPIPETTSMTLLMPVLEHHA